MSALVVSLLAVPNNSALICLVCMIAKILDVRQFSRSVKMVGLVLEPSQSTKKAHHNANVQRVLLALLALRT
jgi:hypothetical protein